MLVRADLPPATLSQWNSTRELSVWVLHSVQFHKLKHSPIPELAKVFKFKGVIISTSCCVIYLSKCPCWLGYVGKPTRPLKNLRTQIQHPDLWLKIAIHFFTANHIVRALKYEGIEQTKPSKRGGDINTQLLRREAFWIYTLDTISPRGKNEEFDLRPFL